MARRLVYLLFHLPAALSALLLLSIAAFQLRSLWRSDSFYCRRYVTNPQHAAEPRYPPSSPPPPRDGPLATSTAHWLSATNITGGGYDLRATPEKCPECGRTPPQSTSVLNLER